MIAMALVNNPELLIADEPTTALDVTVQAQILDLIRDLQKEFGSAVIIITHDLGVVAELADDILVMYGGRCVERGPAEKVFYEPQHPYTWGLLGSMPRIDREQTDRLIPVKGSPPSLINVPSGLRLQPALPVRGRAQGRRHPHRPPRAARGRQRALLRLPHVRRRTVSGSGPKRLRRSCERGRADDDPGSRSRTVRCLTKADPTPGETLLKVDRSGQALPHHARACSSARSARSRRSTASTSTCGRARPSASWASPAAASRRWAG